MTFWKTKSVISRWVLLFNLLKSLWTPFDCILTRFLHCNRYIDADWLIFEAIGFYERQNLSFQCEFYFFIHWKASENCFLCRNQDILDQICELFIFPISVGVFDCPRPSTTTPYCSTSPTTPESACHSAQAADQDRRNQMTDPDYWHSQARGDPVHSAPPPRPLSQPNFQFVRVADILQIHIPEIYRLSIVDLLSLDFLWLGHLFLSLDTL